MSSRVNYYFRQRVTEAELDLGFELLEQADRDLAADLKIYGVVSGAVPAPHSPVPDLSVDLTAPARAYDNLGQRLFFGTGQTVDCSVDLSGIPTEVFTAGSERWLAIFLRFARLLSDPRTDGNSQQVFFRRDESFELVVRQAPEGPAGLAPKAALQADEILLCDVRRRPGQTQIVAADLDLSRRQAFVFVQGSSIGVSPSLWSVLAPLVPTVQSTLDEVDAELRDHFTATARRHTAAAVDYVPHSFVAATTVQAAIDEMLDDLATAATASPGASRIGADAVPGTPNALPAASVDAQLSSLLGFLNAHLSAVSGAHHASSVAATPHTHVGATNVQAQLQEMVLDLQATAAAAPGASLVGTDAIAGTPTALSAGTVRAALEALVAALNGHANQPTNAHAASAISVAALAGRLAAENAEAALDELAEAFEREHLRANEVPAGQHRTIRQPPLGGSKALILDSAASGASATRLRLYADAESVWITVNTSWNGDAWARDSTLSLCAALRISTQDVEFLHENSFAATFPTWSRSWRIAMADALSSFEVQGTVREIGRIGMQWTNSATERRSMLHGGSVTFRSRFAAAPSSITLAPLYTSPGFSGTPSPYLVDRDGFAFLTSQFVDALSSAWWKGTYTVLA